MNKDGYGNFTDGWDGITNEGSGYAIEGWND